MSLLHDFREPAVADAPPHRFRAPTVEAALAAARAELGPDVDVIDANRIRRGGVGGFFATDLGVELTVQPAGRAPATPGAASDAHEGEHDDDRIDADFEARLALLDRAIYGDEPSIGIDRLLHRASGDDGYRRSSAPAGGDASFAEHLARELAASDGQGGVADRPLPRRGLLERGDATGAHPAPVKHTTVPTGGRHPEPTPASRLLSIVGAGTPDAADEANGHDPRAATSDHRADTTDEAAVAAPHETDRDSLPRSSRTAPTIVRNPSAAPLRHADVARPEIAHHAELAAGAVGRLISELAHIAPAHGSRVNQLSRLTVALTAADGSAVEFAAELNGSRHG